jgi:hypothetical protein
VASIECGQVEHLLLKFELLSFSTSIFFVSSPAVGFSTNDQIQRFYGHANKPDPIIFLSFKLSHPKFPIPIPFRLPQATAKISKVWLEHGHGKGYGFDTRVPSFDGFDFFVVSFSNPPISLI